VLSKKISAVFQLEQRLIGFIYKDKCASNECHTKSLAEFFYSISTVNRGGSNQPAPLSEKHLGNMVTALWMLLFRTININISHKRFSIFNHKDHSSLGTIKRYIMNLKVFSPIIHRAGNHRPFSGLDFGFLRELLILCIYRSNLGSVLRNYELGDHTARRRKIRLLLEGNAKCCHLKD
jgi:hypothetical protein